MALVNCENCGAEISDKAKACPKCGEITKEAVDLTLLCPECGEKIEKGMKVCSNCGYILSRKSRNKKIGIIIGIVIVLIAIIGIIISMMSKNNNSHIIDACKEIRKSLSNPNSLSLLEIYTSEKQSTDTTIDYVYRVYVVYKYTNNYDGKEEGVALYLVDDKGKTYFVEDGSEQLTGYKSTAKVEIFGLAGWFEPTNTWTALKSTEIDEIEKEIE